ncbi:unnamed protein product [Orchesella dallaii]|uniref:Isopropylmalate dehydrogenase-like domain-containing protein n=1 Tax=Orchesella dallaii TaxID=48710 RepID=A0ABP1QPW0_9HEXA
MAFCSRLFSSSKLYWPSLLGRSNTVFPLTSFQKSVRSTSSSAQEDDFFRSLPRAKYGGRHTVTLLPGLGIGPELSQFVKQLFRVKGVPIIFEEITINPAAEGLEEMDNAITSIRRNGACLKGNVETRSLNPAVVSRNVTLRNTLDLFVSIYHCLSYPGVVARHKDVNVVIVRQNTDGEYAMKEHEAIPGVVECLKVMTRPHAERLATFAFEYAIARRRKRITTVHKANIMKVSDGMFLEVAREVSKQYPDIKHDDMIIDNCCMQLVSNPHQFDVILTTNLYGSIIVNLIAGLIQGQGLLSGQNYSNQYGVFETATRNTGTDIAGKDLANPIAFLSASADMLYYLKLQEHANRLRKAIHHVINVDKIHTRDIGGNALSSDVFAKIYEHM